MLFRSAAVGSGLAVVYDGVTRYFREVYPTGHREPWDPLMYYPPARWSIPLVPDPNGYTPPIDLNTGEPFDTTEQPWYDPSRPPRGWQNAYWDLKNKRWDRGHPPADLFGMRG